jgi:hypothetical protein
MAPILIVLSLQVGRDAQKENDEQQRQLKPRAAINPIAPYQTEKEGVEEAKRSFTEKLLLSSTKKTQRGRQGTEHPEHVWGLKSQKLRRPCKRRNTQPAFAAQR